MALGYSWAKISGNKGLANEKAKPTAEGGRLQWNVRSYSLQPELLVPSTVKV